ncbi:MAG: lysogenization regulator HflD [Gammaproteobacteria bacterium]|nr:MAG: lysogenization regulator HflD [Gammaproteobacteria bacterium]
MAGDWSDRALALGGVLLAAEAVVRVARTARIDPVVEETLLASVLVTDPETTASVYPDRFVRGEALRLLQRRLSGRQTGPEALEATRYAIALLHLSRKLVRDPRRLERLRTGIAAVRALVEQYGIDHESVRARLAGLYQENVSTLTPRILVQGDPSILATPYRQDEIRALLLAGIRSAVLFHQVGGRRWQVLLQRRHLLSAADRLLREV